MGFGNVASKDSGSVTVESLTQAFTVAANYNGLIVTAAFRSSVGTIGIASVTYNGIALTKVSSAAISGTYNIQAEIWMLLNPPSGTANVVVTFKDSDIRGAIGIVGLTSLNTEDPHGTAISGTTGEATSNQIAVNGNGRQYVLDCLALRTGQVVNSGANQTKLIEEITDSGGSLKPVLGVSVKPAEPSTSMSWTWATVTYSALLGVPLSFSEGGGVRTEAEAIGA